MTTAAFKNSDMKAEDCKVELLHPRPRLLLFLLDYEDTDQGQEEDMLVDKIASADTFMVDVSVSLTVYST